MYADEYILDFNEGSGNVVFNCNGMGIIDLNNFNLDDTSYDEDDPDTIIIIRPLARHIKFEKIQALKKELSEELMPIAWHTNRRWDFWV